VRKLIAILYLVAAMALQFFAVVGESVAFDKNHAGAFAHTLMHWNDEGHHHHDDGSIHQDGSDESLQHLQADGIAGANGALTSRGFPDFARLLSLAPPADAPSARAGPFLEGLKRPPRSAA